MEATPCENEKPALIASQAAPVKEKTANRLMRFLVQIVSCVLLYYALSNLIPYAILLSTPEWVTSIIEKHSESFWAPTNPPQTPTVFLANQLGFLIGLNTALIVSSWPKLTLHSLSQKILYLLGLMLAFVMFEFFVWSGVFAVLITK